MDDQETKAKKPGRVKKFFSDFKAFITKGNIVDLAVAVVVGGAFGAIVTSLVNDIIMPLISLAVGGVDVADWKWIIQAAEYNSEGILTKAEAAIRYGNFLQAILTFLIISFCIFLALRIMIGMQKKLSEIEAGINQLSNKERRAFVKQLKNEGKNKQQINAVLKQREDEAAERARQEAERAKLEEELIRPPTTEELLGEIRDLLKRAQDSQ